MKEKNNRYEDREYWLQTLLKISKPVLEALADKKLKATMPVECKDNIRKEYTYLEAIGRTLAGMAPWLEGSKKDESEESCV